MLKKSLEESQKYPAVIEKPGGTDLDVGQWWSLFRRDFETVRITESDERMVEIPVCVKGWIQEENKTNLSRLSEEERSRRLCRRGGLRSESALNTVYWK